MRFLYVGDDHECLRSAAGKTAATEADIIQAMNDNLCRCGAHLRIVQAVQGAIKEMGGRKG